MKIFKRFIALLLALCLLFSMAGCSNDAFGDGEVDAAIQSAGKYLKRKVLKPGYGDEEVIVALLRSEYINYWHNRAVVYESSVNTEISRNGFRLGEKGQYNASAFPDAIFAYTAIGKYADRLSTANLIDGISIDSVVLEGGYINKIRALIALECGNYEITDVGDLSVERLTGFIKGLARQDGSFSYAGMNRSEIYVTANSVIALAMAGLSDDDAVQNGIQYLENHIRRDDSLEDISYTIIALNTCGITATDVDGKDLTKWIIDRQRSDGSFARREDDKKGSVKETADALYGLASQHRFDKGETSFFDMTDVLGATHNRLSPGWSFYLNVMKIFGRIIIIFIFSIFIVSRIRIRKWRKEGVYDEEKSRRLTDEEIRQLRRQAGEHIERAAKNAVEDAKRIGRHAGRIVRNAARDVSALKDRLTDDDSVPDEEKTPENRTDAEVAVPEDMPESVTVNDAGAGGEELSRTDDAVDAESDTESPLPPDETRSGEDGEKE